MKTKTKIFWALYYKILPPEITEMWEIASLEGTFGTWEPMFNSMVFYDFVNFESFSLYLLVKNSFNFKLGFFTCFEYISAGIIRKTFCIQITIVPGDIDAKKTRKTFHKLQIYNFFSQCLIVISSLLWAFMVQSNCKKSFLRG